MHFKSGFIWTKRLYCRKYKVTAESGITIKIRIFIGSFLKAHSLTENDELVCAHVLDCVSSHWVCRGPVTTARESGQPG